MLQSSVKYGQTRGMISCLQVFSILYQASMFYKFLNRQG